MKVTTNDTNDNELQPIKMTKYIFKCIWCMRNKPNAIKMIIKPNQNLKIKLTVGSR